MFCVGFVKYAWSCLVQGCHSHATWVERAPTTVNEVQRLAYLACQIGFSPATWIKRASQSSNLHLSQLPGKSNSISSKVSFSPAT